MSALEEVVDDGLHAGLHAGHVVAHGVHAGLSRVDLDNVLEFAFAAVKLVLPELALRLALLNHLVLRVLALLQHLLHVAYTDLVKVEARY